MAHTSHDVCAFFITILFYYIYGSMGHFIYSPLNPVRLTHQVAPNAKYNTVPFDRQQAYECYSQKFQFTDTAVLQMLSDFTLVLKEYDADGRLKSTPSAAVTLINNETYSLYKFTIDWSTFTAGGYYIEATYTDTTLQTWQSEVIQLAQNWPNTLLFEYYNTYNKYSCIFTDTTIFQFRIEGAISLFNPEFDSEIYNDQYHATALLDAIPFRTFTLDVGGAPVVPEWVIDRVNWIFGCDRVKIDDNFYRNTDGSKWDIDRTEPDGTRFINGKITVTEVNDLFLQELTPGETPTGGFRIVSRIVTSKNIGGNTVISAQPTQFNADSLIKYLSIVNRGAQITIKAGTSSGASDLMQAIPVPTGADTIEINQRMPASGPIYLTVPTGSDIDVVVGYDQFDAELITPGSIITQIKGRPRSVSMYHYTTTPQLLLDFDLSTGLGINDFAGTAIMNGSNTTQDWGGFVPMGYKKGMKWSDIGMVVFNDPEIPLGVSFGENTHTLTAPELPKLEIILPGATNPNPSQGKIPFSGYSAPGQGKVPLEVFGGDASQPGGGTPVQLQGLAHNNIQKSIYCIYYKELS